MKTRSIISILLCGTVLCAVLVATQAGKSSFLGKASIVLPKVDSDRQVSQKAPVTMSVDENGAVFIEGMEIALEDIGPRLAALLPHGYDDRIYLKANKRSSYDDVIKVMARVNAAGFSNLGLVTDSDSASHN